jgi:hypothetical protein
VKLLACKRIESVRTLDLVDPPPLPDALEKLCKVTGV